MNVQLAGSPAVLCIGTRDPRDYAVLRHPGGRQAPIFRQESEGGIRRRMRKRPGGEGGWRWCLGMEPSVRAAGTHGARLGGSHHGLRNGGCCEVGEPARVLFDAAARDDQHKYSGRSLRATGRGSSRAASGGPPPLEIRGRGGWDRPGFFLGGSGYSLLLPHVRPDPCPACIVLRIVV